MIIPKFKYKFRKIFMAIDGNIKRVIQLNA